LAKRELVEACLLPGVSVARLALEHGLNANLLRSWVTAYKRKRDGGAIVSAPVSSKPTTAFVPVIAAQTQPMQAWAGLQVRLPNGVKIELKDVRDDQVRSLLHALSTLPCFRFDEGLKVLLHRDAVDGRKGINGLAALGEHALGLDPLGQRWPRSVGQFFRFLSGTLGGHAAVFIAGSIVK
jgi:transposase